MSTLEFKNIDFSYDNNQIYKNLSLNIDHHEFLVIVGPSGVGKTTLLRLMAGFEEPQNGTISYDGKILTKMEKTNTTAMVFQNYALFKSMRVKDNIKFGLKLKKLTNPEKEQKVINVAKSLKIDHLLNRYPNQLSGGEMQRVGLARALVRKPNVFLFDEPLSNLDASLKQSMRREIKKIYNSLDATFMYVTHDQTEAMELATKILLLSKKGIEEYASPEVIYKNPKNIFVASFFGEPKINILKGVIRKKETNYYIVYNEEHILLPKEKYDYQVLKKYQDKMIYFGIRPEDVMFTEEGYSYQLESIEYLGKYFVLKVTINNDEIVAISPNNDASKKISFQNIFLFDYKTKKNIMYKSAFLFN